jgi:outer membrane protein OmpA-like peptidoglycan-associated protein
MEGFQGRNGRMPLRGAMLAASGLILLSACAHVGQDQYDADMSQLRQEMQEGDQAVEARLMSEIQQVENQVASLAQELTAFRDDFNVTVERMEAAIRFNAPVHFAFDDATVQPQDHEILDRFATVVQSHYDQATITVEGFTDPAGSRAYNLQLGQRRAEAVQSYLIEAGVPAERLRAVSYGATPERQVAQGAQGPGEMGWENRRVAMVIDFRGDTSQPPRVIAGGDEGN